MNLQFIVYSFATLGKIPRNLQEHLEKNSWSCHYAILPTSQVSSFLSPLKKKKMLEPQLLSQIVMWLATSSGGVHLAHVQISTAIHISDCLVLHCFQAVILGYIQLMYRFPIGHRCRCVCFLLILYQHNVANTFTCVLSTIHSVFVSDNVSKWMREGEKKSLRTFQTGS